MTNSKWILMLVMALGWLGLFAQNSLIRFMDTSDYTLSLVRQEDPEYPTLTPAAQRWVVLAYLSEDDVIDPLSETGEPTGDDIVNPYITGLPGTIMGQVATGLLFGPEQAGSPLGIGAAVITPDHFGKYVYIRIFNSTRIETATKYMVQAKAFEVTQPDPQMINILPDYAWDVDPVWKWIKPEPEKQ